MASQPPSGPMRDLTEVFRSSAASRLPGEDTLSNFRSATKDSDKPLTTEDEVGQEGSNQTNLFEAMQEQKRKVEEKKEREEDEEMKRIAEEDARWSREVELSKREKERLMREKETAEREMFRKERLKLIERKEKEEQGRMLHPQSSMGRDEEVGLKRNKADELDGRESKRRLLVVKKKSEVVHAEDRKEAETSQEKGGSLAGLADYGSSSDDDSDSVP